MKYRFTSYQIRDLIDWIEKDKIDLKPYYQRNDIWTKGDQQSLIDTILKGYPLPSFFVYCRTKNNMDMVDGQQRARTIYRFFKEQITNSSKQYFPEINKEAFLSYELSFTEMYNVSEERELEEFYVLVNKKGKHLTTPEIHKAEFAHTNFLTLVEELLEYQNFINLDLFTEASARRMGDRNYVEELVAYLILGIQDKKLGIEPIYKEDITKEESKKLKTRFNSIIDRISYLNDIFPISETRYKQKNDFYTFFNFVDQNTNASPELLGAQYEVLLLLDPFISPSNEDCHALREYALNCVSQSNSRKARVARLQFFNDVLLNKEKPLQKNETLGDIVNFIDHKKPFKAGLKNVDGYYLLSRIS